ncbi:hypothetical protein [Pantoea sp. Nvir]|uniref:hypothetical protein n=1 Tax=Pantoea sp. Nvir TaxID=2576760 RepID=UPI0027F85EB5|nr:hypothetical protein [Pantoea sp. Nvir]CAJ0993073.1 hypothetical protein NVIRPANT_00877 [Pantoea sp. Nvir]
MLDPKVKIINEMGFTFLDNIEVTIISLYNKVFATSDGLIGPLNRLEIQQLLP